MKRFRIFNHTVRICVVGIGGGGSNAVNHMIKGGVRGVDYIAINTDSLSLMLSEASTHVHIGDSGQGTGGDVRTGRIAAWRKSESIEQALRGADLVFITSGLGGGTGTGASPVVARIARKLGALTIGVVTHPFTFEGTQRSEIARRGMEELGNAVDTLIAIPNDNLLLSETRSTSLPEAFRQSDTVLKQAIEGITEIIAKPGKINLDFADVRTIMGDGGRAVMAIGSSEGEGAAVAATRQALDSAMLGMTADGAKGVLFNVRASSQMPAIEMYEAAELVKSRVDHDVNFIFGLVEDDSLGDKVQITLIATGVDPELERLQRPEVLPKRIVPQSAAPMRSFRPRREPVTVSPTRAHAQLERVLQATRRPIAPSRARVPVARRFSAETWSRPAYLQS